MKIIVSSNMKVTYRIPTKEQFAFVEVETNPTDLTPVEMIRSYYSELTQTMTEEGLGLSTKDFAKVLCEYAQTGAIVDGGNYEFSEAQKVLMGEMRKLIRKNPPQALVEEVNGELEADKI